MNPATIFRKSSSPPCAKDDRIELKHTIKNRRTLALGAVVAAEFLCGKKGVYTMDDLLK